MPRPFSSLPSKIEQYLTNGRMGGSRSSTTHFAQQIPLTTRTADRHCLAEEAWASRKPLLHFKVAASRSDTFDYHASFDSNHNHQHRAAHSWSARLPFIRHDQSDQQALHGYTAATTARILHA